MTFNLEEYEVKYAELESLAAGSRVVDLDGVAWIKEWGGMWASAKPMKLNSLALVSEFNPAPVKDKNADKGSTLFDL